MIKNYKIHLILARDLNGGIGKDNELLFKIPADLKRFKKLTEFNPIIMGRKTFESIGKILPNRYNIVLTSKQAFYQKTRNITGPLFVNVENTEKAIEIFDQYCFKTNKSFTDIYIIGGANVYEQFYDYADEVHLTQIYSRFEADTFFDYDFYEKFMHIHEHPIQEYEGLKYQFIDFKEQKLWNK